MRDVAEKLLELFVSNAGAAYGKGIYVMNIHCLLHITDDVAAFGNLDKFSCFPFENFLDRLKRLLRTPCVLLQQVVKRLSELDAAVPYVYSPRSISETILLEEERIDGPVPCGFRGKQFKIIILKQFSLQLNEGDSVVQMTNGSIVKIRNILKHQCGSVSILGNAFTQLDDFYVDPLPSSQISIVVATNMSLNMEVWGISNIKHKVVCLPTASRKYLILPLFHLV